MEASGDTLVIRKSLWKLALAVLGCAAFVVCGVLLIGNADGLTYRSPEMARMVGWLSVLLFGPCGILLAIGLVRPPTLVLTPQGFTLTAWPRRVAVSWTSLCQVFLLEAGRVGSVNWRLYDDAPERGAVSDFSRKAGSDGSAGGGWAMSPQQVVNTMEDFRRRFGRPDPIR